MLVFPTLFGHESSATGEPVRLKAPKPFVQENAPGSLRAVKSLEEVSVVAREAAQRTRRLLNG